MTYPAKPNTQALVLWVISFFLITGLVYWDNSEHWSWPLSVGVFLYPILMQSWMHFVSYKIEDQELKVSPSTYWENRFDLDKLISVKEKTPNLIQRLIGMPKETIELNFERHGHMELWTDNENLLDQLQDFIRSEPSSLVKE